MLGPNERSPSTGTAIFLMIPVLCLRSQQRKATMRAASHKLNLNQGHKWASDEALRKGTESVTTDEVIARTATR